MKTALRKFFFNNWQRKATSVLLAIIIWFFVNQSLTTSKTFSNIPVKVVNIPEGKTVQGLQSTGFLKKRMTMTVVGNKTLIDELSSNDLEVVVDAQGKPDEWTPLITPKNLVSLNPEIEISSAVSKIYSQGLTVRLTTLVTERIPISITKPIGDAPRDYQFLDIWPYELTLSVTGPEEIIKRIKAKEIRLTFNLNDISKAQLDALHAKERPDDEDVVSFFVPESWKVVNLPLISDTPLVINDPLARDLRIDFVRYDLFPLETPIPVSLFFPQEYLSILNPEAYQIAPTPFLHNINGVYLTQPPLFAKGVSHLFLQIVKDMLQITVIAAPKTERDSLEWSLQFINARQLEKRYISALQEENEMQTALKEDYLRNRFRNFMNRFQLFNADGKKLSIQSELEDHSVLILPKS